MKTVYIVEDDADIQESLAVVLRHGGYEVEATHSPLEALGRLQSGFRPSVILLDLMLPEMSGDEVLEVLRGDHALAAVPVCLVTAAHPHDCPEGCPVLLKPFDYRALLATVRELSCT
jgi:CheY-like chemotaxis protein